MKNKEINEELELVCTLVVPTEAIINEVVSGGSSKSERGSIVELIDKVD